MFSSPLGSRMAVASFVPSVQNHSRRVSAPSHYPARPPPLSIPPILGLVVWCPSVAKPQNELRASLSKASGMFPPLAHRRLTLSPDANPLPKGALYATVRIRILTSHQCFFLFRETLWFVCLTLASSPSPYKTAPENSRRCRLRDRVCRSGGIGQELKFPDEGTTAISQSSRHNPYRPSSILSEKRLLRFLDTDTPEK